MVISPIRTSPFVFSVLFYWHSQYPSPQMLFVDMPLVAKDTEPCDSLYSYLPLVILVALKLGKDVGGEILKGILKLAANRDLKVQVGLLRDLHHGAVSDRAEKLTALDACALGNATRKGLGKVLIIGARLAIVADLNAPAHLDVVPDLGHRTLCRRVNGRALGGVDVDAEVDSVFLHGGREDLKLGVVLEGKRSRHGKLKGRELAYNVLGTAGAFGSGGGLGRRFGRRRRAFGCGRRGGCG